VIAYKLRQTHLIELKNLNVFGIIVRNVEEISYKCTVTYLHLCANDTNSGPLTYTETQLRKLSFYRHEPNPMTVNNEAVPELGIESEACGPEVSSHLCGHAQSLRFI